MLFHLALEKEIEFLSVVIQLPNRNMCTEQK